MQYQKQPLHFLCLASVGSQHQRNNQPNPEPGKPVTIPHSLHRGTLRRTRHSRQCHSSLVHRLRRQCDALQGRRRKLGVKAEVLKGEADNGGDLTLASLPAFKPEASVPRHLVVVTRDACL